MNRDQPSHTGSLLLTGRDDGRNVNVRDHVIEGSSRADQPFVVTHAFERVVRRGRRKVLGPASIVSLLLVFEGNVYQRSK
jgi:hypothetical protein